MIQNLKAPVTIVTDGKYCDKKCGYHEGVFIKPSCGLFLIVLDICLGGGPLRCKKCLKMEEI